MGGHLLLFLLLFTIARIIPVPVVLAKCSKGCSLECQKVTTKKLLPKLQMLLSKFHDIFIEKLLKLHFLSFPIIAN